MLALSIYMSVCLFLRLPAYVAACLPVCKSVSFLSVCLPVYLFVCCLSVCQSICVTVCLLTVFLPVCLATCLSGIYLFVLMPVCLPACLPSYLSIADMYIQIHLCDCLTTPTPPTTYPRVCLCQSLFSSRSVICI